MVLALAALTLCTGCKSLVGRMYHRTGPQDVYNGVRLDFVEIGHGDGWMILDLPFSFVCDTLLLPYDLTGPLPYANPLQGWKGVGFWTSSPPNRPDQGPAYVVLTWASSPRRRPHQAITDDVLNYIRTQKLPANVNASFWENGTGHHAVRIIVTDRGKQTDYVLFYNEQNVRIKRLKLKYARPWRIHM